MPINRENKTNVLLSETNAKENVQNDLHVDRSSIVVEHKRSNENLWHPNFAIKPLSGSKDEINPNKSVCKNATDKSVVVIVLSDYKNIELR